MAHLWTRSARAKPDWRRCPSPEAICRGEHQGCGPFDKAILLFSARIAFCTGGGRSRRAMLSPRGSPAPPLSRACAPSAMRHIASATSTSPASRMLRSAWICNDSVFSPEPCAIAVGLGHGLNTILGPLVRSNAGSPTSVGRPAKYKTLLPLVGAGNTWGVVTSVPACSTVPATAVDGTRAMSLIRRFLTRLRRRKSPSKAFSGNGSGMLQIEALVQAHGDWLALLATILERERVISGAELARTLSEFAAHTAEDRPAEGQILSFWASRLTDTAATLGKLPSVH